MHDYLRSGDVAPPWGGIDPQDTERAVRLRSPDGTIPYVMLLVFIVAMYGVVQWTVPALRSARPALTLGLGAISVLLVERTMSGRRFRLSWPEGHALVAFFGAAALSSINALWPRFAVENTIDFGKTLVLYLLIVNVVSTRARLRGLMWTMVLAGVLPARGTINNYLIGNVLEGDRAAWVGKFSGPNEVAFELVILIPLAVALMGTARWWGRLLLCGALAVYLPAIFFTYSRSGLLGLGAMAAVGVLRLRSHVMRALAVVGIVAAVAIGMQFWERDEGFEDLENDTTFNQRLTSIQVGLAMLRARPAFGIGLGCSSIGYRSFSPDPFSTGKEVMIHNTIVQALAETGLVGFSLLLGATLVVMVRMRRVRALVGFVDPELRAYANAVELAVIAFAVAGLANGFVMATAPYLLIALGSATWGVVVSERQGETA